LLVIAGGFSDADICLWLFFADKTKVEQASSDLKVKTASLNLAFVTVCIERIKMPKREGELGFSKN
jgi:hypothetical protein